MDFFLVTLFILFVFSVGMVWGWSMARDRFHSRDYILGFNKGYDVGARFMALNLEKSEPYTGGDELPF